MEDLTALDLSDGIYSVEVSLEGGSGRATVTSPTQLFVADGAAKALVEWSSSNYDYMIVGGERYLPLDGYDQSAFLIPVEKLGESLEVVADTTAMSVPHEIAYTLTFDGGSLIPLEEQADTTGKNFVKTMLRLAETHDEVRVVRDQVGSPTSAAELAKMIAYLLPTDNYGLFHGTCEGVCSWADFAAEIFRLAGKKTHVEGITTAEYEAGTPTAAPRPAYSVLDNYMLRLTTDYRFAQWEDAIREYIAQM